MDQPPKDEPETTDRGLMIMLIVLGLVFMAFVLMAGIAGLTP